MERQDMILSAAMESVVQTSMNHKNDIAGIGD
jgi:hypothetical protein